MRIFLGVLLALVLADTIIGFQTRSRRKWTRLVGGGTYLYIVNWGVKY